MEVLQTPIKSPNDKKDYRLIKLENGLKVLLISKPDNEEEKSISAAALCAFVGSYDNPPHVKGLAHFFEHMILLDTGNYETNFKEYIENHGGYCNAMTANDFTQYEFMTNEENFSEALRRFSEIFISPMLNKNLMQNERINVDSEFRLSKQNAENRRAHLNRLYLNQVHHASRFPTGNLKTLKDDVTDDILHDELVKFFEKYVANKMTLCVQSTMSLDDLQKDVVDNFTAIKRNDSIMFNYELPVNFDELVKPEFYSKVLYIKDSNESSLTLTWLLPPVNSHYKSKPLEIIDRIMQNNGEGGLEPYLKDKNLIRFLSFTYNTWLSSKQFTCLRMEFDLTELGAEKIEEILAAIYSYLLLLKTTKIEEYQRLFNDLKEDAEKNFKFLTDDHALDNVGIAKRMNTYEDEDILRGPYTLKDFDGDLLMDYVNRLNENKFNITIFTNKREIFRLREDLFEIDYDEEELSEKFKILWDERQLNDKFFLEKPNPYKAKNFEIFEDDEELDHPEKIFKNEKFEIWHMLDRKFKQPKVNIEMFIVTKDHCKTVEVYAYNKILEKIISEAFDKKFWQMYQAGMVNNVNYDEDYFYITFNGYNEKMLLMIDETFAELKNILGSLEEAEFIKKLSQTKRNLKEGLIYPREIGRSEMDKILCQKHFTSFEVLDVIDQLKFDNFKNSIKEMFTQLKVTALIQGNMKKEDALKISTLFQNYFEFDQLNEEIQPTPRGHELPKGSYTLRMKSPHPTDDATFLMSFYQDGPYTIHAQNLAVMLGNFLNPKAFDMLRTKLQLSYSVGFIQMKINKVIGFILAVRSNEENIEFLKIHEKMEEFINVHCWRFLENMTDEEFETIKKGRIAALLEPHLTLDAEFASNMREIQEQTYNFNRNNEAIEDAKKILKTDLQAYFSSVFDSQNIRQLIIQVIGKKKSEIADDVIDDSPKREIMREKMEIDENLITDVNEFKKTLTLYPVNYN